MLEVSIVDFLLDRVAATGGALTARRGGERFYPDLEITGPDVDGDFYAVDIKVAQRKVPKTKNVSPTQTQSRITLYTGNTYFAHPTLHWPGTFRPFAEYAQHFDVVGIYTLNRDSAARPPCAITGPVTGGGVRIRPYQPGDRDELYRICLLTADDGEDGSRLFRDPALPGHVYVGPYVTFEPSLALVARDPGGVGGYILAALDTQAFEQRLKREWWPALRASYPERDPADYVSTAEQYAIHDIHHPWSAADELASRFPSHLHIDLIPRLQGRGIGRQLIAMMISILRSRGSHGLHLVVGHGNKRAAGFYRHVGFTEFPATHLHIFTMDLESRAERQPRCRGAGCGCAGSR